MSDLRIATRGSALALWQARHVAALLEQTLGLTSDLVPMKTTGDRLQSVSLAKVGGKGLFVKEIEEALLDGRADVAVHSGKDLPATLPPALALVAFPERADARDALVTAQGSGSVASLPQGARVGTGSARRRALLLLARPDLRVEGLRGNVPTRLARLEEGELAAVVLACAGLDRLDRSDRVHERIAPDVMLPAAAQGIIAVQMRADDTRGEAVAAALTHGPTARSLAAERAFVEGLGADCTVPAAAHAVVGDDGSLHVRGLVASPDGAQVARAERTAAEGGEQAAGAAVAREVLASGGQAILDALEDPT